MKLRELILMTFDQYKKKHVFTSIENISWKLIHLIKEHRLHYYDYAHAA